MSNINKEQFIGNIRKQLPLYSGKYVLYELSERDIFWYKNQMLKPYFNVNIVSNYGTDNYEEYITKFLNMYIKLTQDIKNDCKQLRMVIKDIKANALIGGVTIYKRDNNKILELGYWVVPDRQGTGVMSEIFPEIVRSLNKVFDASYQIHLEIFNDNLPQKSLAIKNHFFEIRRRSYNNNREIVTYGLDRRSL